MYSPQPFSAVFSARRELLESDKTRSDRFGPSAPFMVTLGIKSSGYCGRNNCHLPAPGYRPGNRVAAFHGTSRSPLPQHPIKLAPLSPLCRGETDMARSEHSLWFEFTFRYNYLMNIHWVVKFFLHCPLFGKHRIFQTVRHTSPRF